MQTNNVEGRQGLSQPAKPGRWLGGLGLTAAMTRSLYVRGNLYSGFHHRSLVLGSLTHFSIELGCLAIITSALKISQDVLNKYVDVSLD